MYTKPAINFAHHKFLLMIRLVYHFDIINIKELDVSKVIQVVVYKSVSDPEKLAAYAVLARPAMEKAGAKFIARGVPFAVKEDGEAVRTIVIEWESMEAAENGYNSPDYQNALKALDNGAKRAFMYLDAD